jgi:glycine/D-amino acid oxidase-like deaminating enzyme
VWVSGSRHLPVARELGAREGTSPEVQRLLEANLHELEPSHRVNERWSGVQAVACDGLPVVGAVPGRPRVLVSGGFGMNGLGWAFVAAETIAALIEHGRAEHGAALSARRFL